MDTLSWYRARLETDLSNRPDEVWPEMAHFSPLPVRSQGAAAAADITYQTPKVR